MGRGHLRGTTRRRFSSQGARLDFRGGCHGQSCAPSHDAQRGTMLGTRREGGSGLTEHGKDATKRSVSFISNFMGNWPKIVAAVYIHMISD